VKKRSSETGWKWTADRVSLLGSLLGVASLAFGWLTLRPNRLARGNALPIWNSLGIIWLLIALLWLACLCLSLTARSRRSAFILGLCADLVLVVSLLACGLAASRLLEGHPAIARISLSAGFWLTLAGAYITIFAVRQRLGSSPARLVISWAGLLFLVVLPLSGWLDHISLVQEFSANAARFRQELSQHLLLVAVSVAVGSLLGMALSLWAARSRRAEKPIVWVANITQTIPSLALFGLLMAPLSALSFAFPVLRGLGLRGVGNTPALIALVLYSLLPVIRNTLAGLHQVEPSALDAGRGMGMSRKQLFRRVEAPLAAPIILEGVRIAAVQCVGLTAVAALIGAGGLGWFIFQGIGQAATDLILVGAIPIVILALAVDALMRLVVRLATPRGVAGGTA
jgi:osmoprotectant transport system permease protein